eukprot:223245_1
MAEYEVPKWCHYVFIGLTLMNECILVPCILYFTYRFWKFRYDIFFAKRHPKLVVFYSICMASNPFLRPLMLYQYWYLPEPFWVKMLGYYTTALGFTAAFARFWLTLYDFNYNQTLYRQKLQQQVMNPQYLNTPITVESVAALSTPIDTPHPEPVADKYPEIIQHIQITSDTNTKQESFWIKYRSHFGKVKGLMICASILLLVYMTVITYLRTISKLLCVSVHLIYLLTVTVSGYLATRQISQYRDEFSIYNEGEVVKQPALLFLALFGVSIVIEPIHPPLTNVISTILTFLAASVGISIFTLVSLCWALYEHRVGYQLLHNANDADVQQESVTFNECMQHHEGYYIFFEYLVGEFSVESMNFVTDVLYFKEKFGGNMHVDHEWPQLSKKLYLSQNMRRDNLYEAIVSVYEMYAKVGSVCEINISGDERQQIKRTMSKMQETGEAEMDIFDNAVDDVLYLLKQAFTRFIHTKEYNIFATAFIDKYKKKVTVIKKSNTCACVIVLC